jgi:glucosylglycerate synthase
VSDTPVGTEAASAFPGGIAEQMAALRPRDIVVGILTYNNAATAPAVIAAGRAGLDRSFAGVPAAVVDADAGSSDDTPALVAAAGLAVVPIVYQPPLSERTEVPFHGVPGRGAALRATFAAARELGARVLLLVEADVPSIEAVWLERLARPVWEEKADFVAPVYERHRYDGTITNLLLSPLVRALYGRRLHQPLGGHLALSGRLVEHVLLHPQWNWTGRDISDLWTVGTAIADGFSVWEAWLGRRQVDSATRTTDLPAMIAQTLGAVFTVMDRHEDLWLEVRGSEPVPAVGEPRLPSAEPRTIDVERLLDGFRLGLRDLIPIWEHILAPDTLGDVMSLDRADSGRFTFPDDLWARIIYDFALGHHYAVVHRDHLLRSLVPLYLGRTAAYVRAAEGRTAEATEALLEQVSLAFERQKRYLVERWR